MIKRKPPVSFPHVSFIRRLSFSVQPFIVTKSLPHNLEALNGKSVCQKVYRGFKGRSRNERRTFVETHTFGGEPGLTGHWSDHRRGHLRAHRARRRLIRRPGGRALVRTWRRRLRFC